MSMVWGARQGRRAQTEGSGPWWAAWCLVGCACCLLSLCSAVVRRQGLLRALASGVAGALLGLYFDVRFMPSSTLLTASAATSSALAGMFIASLAMLGQRSGAARGGGGVLWMQLIFVLFVAILPMTYMMQPALLKGIPAHYRAEALQLRRAGLLGMHASLSLLLALVVKLKMARAEAEYAAAASGGRRASGVLRGRVGVAGKVMAAAEVAASDWIPSAGNVAAVLAFVQSVHLCVGHLSAGPAIVFVLSPVLLLLHQDTGLFSKLTDKQVSFSSGVAPAPCSVYSGAVSLARVDACLQASTRLRISSVRVREMQTLRLDANSESMRLRVCVHTQMRMGNSDTFRLCSCPCSSWRARASLSSCSAATWNSTTGPSLPNCLPACLPFTRGLPPFLPRSPSHCLALSSPAHACL